MNLAILCGILLSNGALFAVVLTAFGLLPGGGGTGRHVLWALIATLLTLFSHCLVMFYLIGTGKMVKEIVAEAEGLDAEAYRHKLLSFKRRGFPLPTWAIVAVMAAFIVGAGVHTGAVPKPVHVSLALFALLLNLAASWREVRILIENGILIFDLNEALAKAREEEGAASQRGREDTQPLAKAREEEGADSPSQRGREDTRGGGRSSSTHLGAILLLAFGLSPISAWGAEVALPDFPFRENGAIVVEERLIGDFAEVYCDAAPSPSAVTFLLGALPQGSTDLLCEEQREDVPPVEALFGNFYVSGYFGGLWLRDHLVAEESSAVARATEGTMPDLVRFQRLVAVVRRLTRLSEGTDPRRLRMANRKSLPSLLSIYGYNLGYLEVLLENPPSPETELPEEILSCPSFLACEAPRTPLLLLDEFGFVFDSLEAAASPLWRALGRLVTKWGEGSVESGRAVWEDIFSDEGVAPEAYVPLVELSVGFLLVTEGAILPAMQGWAEGDTGAGRCALLAEAALRVWSSAYFLGLTSNEAEGIFPSLSCNEPPSSNSPFSDPPN